MTRRGLLLTEELLIAIGGGGRLLQVTRLPLALFLRSRLAMDSEMRQYHRTQDEHPNANCSFLVRLRWCALKDHNRQHIFI